MGKTVTTVATLSHAELRRAMRVAYATKAPAFISGRLGIGKSMEILRLSEELAASQGRKFLNWNAVSLPEKREATTSPGKFFIFADDRFSQKDTVDLKGLPAFNEGDAVVWKPNLLVLALSHPDSAGIWFLDELNLAPPTVQAAAYQVIHDRQVGEYALGPGVYVCAAGNTHQDRANVFHLPAPLANRFVHFELAVPNIERWQEWAIPQDVPPQIISFLSWRPSLLFSFDSSTSESAFPTPRSWARAGTLIQDVLRNSTRETPDFDFLYILTACAVGSGAASEFISFLRTRESLDLISFLKDPEKLSSLGDHVDRKWAAVTGLAELYRANRSRDKEGGTARECSPDREDLVRTGRGKKKREGSREDAVELATLDAIFKAACHLDGEFAVLLGRLARQVDRAYFLATVLSLPSYEDFKNRFVHLWS
jgi:hypothetical protein